MGTGPAAGNVHRHHTSVTVPDKEEQMTTLAALTTPCLLLEDEKLQANMANIRKKLGWRPGDNRYVTNELGVGYRMLDE